MHSWPNKIESPACKPEGLSRHLTACSARLQLASREKIKGVGMTGLEILKRDMNRLREAIRLDWQDLDNNLLTRIERRSLKEPSVALMVELKLLLEKL